MKKVLALAFSALVSACSYVQPGYVGIKVDLHGGGKGIEQEVLGPGRYYVGMNEQLYVFPTFQQNNVWSASAHEGKSAVDESITFQTSEGMDINCDVGIGYHLEANKVPQIFAKYQKGIDEITDIFLRNAVRDALVKHSAGMSVTDMYSSGKQKLFEAAQKTVQDELGPTGIIVDKLYLVGFRAPASVVAAINLKIEATQKAQQRENEVAEAKAQADKEVAQAVGQAKARLTVATAEAQANEIKRRSLSPELVEYEKAQKWDGKLPMVMGGNGGFLLQMPEKALERK